MTCKWFNYSMIHNKCIIYIDWFRDEFCSHVDKLGTTQRSISWCHICLEIKTLFPFRKSIGAQKIWCISTDWFWPINKNDDFWTDFGSSIWSVHIPTSRMPFRMSLSYYKVIYMISMPAIRYLTVDILCIIRNICIQLFRHVER